jgi:hypothetical protein
MKPIVNGNVPVPTMNSLPARKSFPAPAEKFPCDDPMEIRKFARTASGSQRKLAPAIVALTERLKKIATKFPASKEFGDQA